MSCLLVTHEVSGRIRNVKQTKYFLLFSNCSHCATLNIRGFFLQSEWCPLVRENLSRKEEGMVSGKNSRNDYNLKC